jgi:hypothetical protein
MRGLRPRSATRHRASAWLALASLLALLGLQPLHGGPRSEHSTRSARAEAALAVSASDAHAAAHDAGACQVCRAVSQVRSGVRPALALRAAQDAREPLHVPAAALPGAAPTLRDAWPRAPPAARTA